jgi:hypothetical protein
MLPSGRAARQRLVIELEAARVLRTMVGVIESECNLEPLADDLLARNDGTWCPFNGRSGHRIFFHSCRSPACSNVFQSKQHAAGHSAGAILFARGRYLRQQPGNAPEIAEG